MEQLVKRLAQQQSGESVALWRLDDDPSNEDASATSVTLAELFAWTSAVRDCLQQPPSLPPSSPLIVGIALPPCSLEETALVLAVVREQRWSYVPIDVTLPLAQQLFMFQDAGVNTLVTLPEAAIAQFLTENVCGFLRSAPRIVESDARGVFQSLSVFSLTQAVAAPEPLHETASFNDNSDAPLYILYTSGSTGQPKGVLGTRKGALNRLQWMWQQFPFDHRNERVMRLTKLSFVDSVWEILGALLQRVPLVHLQQRTDSQPAAHAILSQSELFLQAIERCQVSRFTVVPSVLEVLLLKYSTSSSAVKVLQRGLTSVKYILISGEVLPLSLVVQATSALPHATLLNLYGSTEVSGDITWLEIQAPLSMTDLSLWREHGVPIGKLENRIGDTILRLQVNGSEHVQLQSASFPKVSESATVEGELLATGSALALGYTREIPTVAGSDDDAMKRWVTFEGEDSVWFRMGDIVRVLGDSIFFCGRRDSLVKIRGQRIQLEAVERIFEVTLAAEETGTTSSDQILHVVVLAMKDPSSYGLTSQSMVAFLLVQGNSQSVSSSSSSSSKLRGYPEKVRLFKWIRTKYGDAYVPRDAVVVSIDSVERLSSGKVDRAALQVLYETEMTPIQGIKNQEALVVPYGGQIHSRVKPFLVTQVVKVLGIRGGDNLSDWMSRTFQELGGNSLLAMLLSWELQQEFGCTIQPDELHLVTLGEVVKSLERRTMDQSHREAAADCDRVVSAANSTGQAGAEVPERGASPSASPARKRPKYNQQHAPEADAVTKRNVWSLSRCSRTSTGHTFVANLSSTCSATSIAPLRAELAWQVDLGKCIDASPLVIRRSIAGDSTQTPTTTKITTWAMIGSHSTEFACVDVANNGSVIWKRKLDDRIEASAAMSECNETLFVGTYSGALYALDIMTGVEKWIFQARDAIKAAVLVIDALQLVVCGAYDHKLYGIDSVNGDKRWELEIADNGSLFSTPVYVSESSQLFFASTKGSVCCVALHDTDHDPSQADSPQPKQTWTRQLPAPIFSSLIVAYSVSADQQWLLVGCADGNLYALDTRNGEIQWRVVTHKPIFSSPCVYESRDRNEEALLFGSHDGVLRKVACHDGHVVWSTDLGNPIFSSPSVLEAVVASSLSTSPYETQEVKQLMCCVATIDGTLFVCDEATGAILTRVNSSSAGGPALGELFSSPVVINDLCLIGSRSNQLYAFRLTGKQPKDL